MDQLRSAHGVQPSFSRNLGVLDEQEQRRLASARVAIAGVGGDGGLVAEVLTRVGVGAFHLADPERFETENINRQAFCTVATVGRAKVSAVEEGLHAINPRADIVCFDAGVTPGNIDAFVDGVDLVIDETEYTRHELAVLIGRAARARGLTVLTGFNVAFGAALTSFDPNGVTIEQFLGCKDTDPLDQVAATEVPLERWLQQLPDYIAPEVIADVSSGRRPAPSVAPGVALAAGLVATAAVALLLGRSGTVIAPDVLYLDALELRMDVIRHRVGQG